MSLEVLKRKAAPRAGCCDELVARSVEVFQETVIEPTDWTHLQYCNAPALVAGGTKCPRHIRQPNRGLLYRWCRFVRLGGAG